MSASAARVWSLNAAPEPLSVRDARTFVCDRVTDLGFADLAEAASLGISELATNAVLHARTPFTVFVTALDSGGLRVGVRDASMTMPTLRDGLTSASIGRGLRLVEWLSDEWGTDLLPEDDSEAPGKNVWFEVGTAGTPALFPATIEAEAPPAERPVDKDMVEIRLLSAPLKLYAREIARHRELMREMALIALARTLPSLDEADDEPSAEHSHVPVALVALAAELETYGDISAGTDELRDAALARGEDTVDLVYRVPPDLGPACQRLNRLLDDADAYCRAENLLTLEAPAEGTAMRRWLLGQISRQLAGHPARPWVGPLS